MKMKPSQCKPLDQCASQVKCIIHIHILTLDGKVAVFQRNCGRWSCVSGEVELGESWAMAAKREVREETTLIIKDVKRTRHVFIGVSPKGKPIIGRTYFTIISSDLLLASNITFNGELKSALLLPPMEALLLMKTRGFPEAAEGLRFIFKHLFQKTNNPNLNFNQNNTNKANKRLLNLAFSSLQI